MFLSLISYNLVINVYEPASFLADKFKYKFIIDFDKPIISGIFSYEVTLLTVPTSK